MASPRPLRPMRGKRAASAYQEDPEEEEEDQQQAPARRHRPGKEPVGEDYEQQEEEEDERSQARSRRGRQGGDAGAGPSSKKARPPRAPARRPLRQAGPGGAQQDDAGPIAVPARELNSLQELLAAYKLAADDMRRRFKGNISRQELDNLVRRVMRHMLFQNTEKPGQPVSRAELTKLVASSTTQKKHNMAGLVITLAQSKMLEVFGLEMREITKAPQRGANKGAAAAAGEGTKHLVLRSAVPPTLLERAVQERGEDAVRGFAAVLVSLIELSGGKLTHAELWPLLEEMGVHENQPHPRLGRPADLLDALTRRQYINVDRQPGADGEVRIYTIAENAADEIGADNVKLFYESEFARGGEEGEEEGSGGGGAAAGAQRQQEQVEGEAAIEVE